MTPDPAAEIARLAADVQLQAGNLIDRIRSGTPRGQLPNEFVGYLNLAANLIAIAAAEVAENGLYVNPAPTSRVDRVLAKAGA